MHYVKELNVSLNGHWASSASPVTMKSQTAKTNSNSQQLNAYLVNCMHFCVTYLDVQDKTVSNHLCRGIEVSKVVHDRPTCFDFNRLI